MAISYVFQKFAIITSVLHTNAEYFNTQTIISLNLLPMKQIYYTLMCKRSIQLACTLLVAAFTSLMAYGQSNLDALARVQTSETIPTETEWPADVKWQYLTIHNNRYPLQYTPSQSEIPLTSGMTSTYTDNHLWAIIGTPAEGYRIYNKAAGPSKVLSSPKGNLNGKPILKDLSTLAATDIERWRFLMGHNSVKGSVYIAEQGTNNRMNRNGSKLSFWSGADGGSAFLSFPVNATTPPTQAIRTSYSQLTTANLAINIKAGARFMFHETFGSVDGYMFDDGYRSTVQIKQARPILNFPPHINYAWELVATAEDDVFNVKNVGTNRFVGDVTAQGELPVNLVTSAEQAMKVQVVIDNSRVAIRRKDPIGSDVMFFHGFGSRNDDKSNRFVVFRNSQSAYQLIPIQTAEPTATPTVNITVQHEGIGTNGASSIGTTTASLYSGQTLIPAFFNPILQDVTAFAAVGSSEDNTFKLTYNLPFDLTTDISNPIWQGMQLHRTNKFTIAANAAGTELELHSAASAASRITDPTLWVVTGNLVDGFKIYNKLHGTGKVLYSDNANNGTYVKLGDATEHASSVFFIANHGNGYVVYRKKTPNGQAYFNNFSGAGKVRYWQSADDGSMVFFTNQATLINDAKTTIAEALTPYEATKDAGYIGSLSTADYNALNNQIGSLNSLEDLIHWNNEIKAKQMPYHPGRFYRILFKDNTNKRIKVAYSNDQINAYTSTDNDVASLWQLSGESTAIKLSNPNTGKYTAFSPGGLYLNNKDEATAATHELMQGNDPVARVLKLGTSFIGLNNPDQETSSLGQSIAINVPNAQFYLQEVATHDVTITDAGYATMTLPFAVTLPTGLKAMIITSVNATHAQLTTLAEATQVVPANTPVVLQGTPGIYTLTIAYDDATSAPSNNLLDGVTAPGALTEADYIFAKPDGEAAGFYRTSSAIDTFGPNKAILRGANANPSSGAALLFGDITTGLHTATTQTQATIYYNLQGQRVAQPTRGIYITSEGKKVIIK